MKQFEVTKARQKKANINEDDMPIAPTPLTLFEAITCLAALEYAKNDGAVTADIADAAIEKIDAAIEAPTL